MWALALCYMGQDTMGVRTGDWLDVRGRARMPTRAEHGSAVSSCRKHAAVSPVFTFTAPKGDSAVSLGLCPNVLRRRGRSERGRAMAGSLIQEDGVVGRSEEL